MGSIWVISTLTHSKHLGDNIGNLFTFKKCFSIILSIFLMFSSYKKYIIYKYVENVFTIQYYNFPHKNSDYLFVNYRKENDLLVYQLQWMIQYQHQQNHEQQNNIEYEFTIEISYPHPSPTPQHYKPCDCHSCIIFH